MSGFLGGECRKCEEYFYDKCKNCYKDDTSRFWIDNDGIKNLSLYNYDKLDIMSIKYNKNLELLRQLLHNKMENIFQWISDLNMDRCIWVYIPSTANKLLKRGYNVGLLMIERLSKEFGGEVISPGVLAEISDGMADKFSDSIQRKIKKKVKLLGNIDDTTETIIIVDDVICTGATIEGVMRVIYDSGYTGKMRYLFLYKR